MIFVCGGVVGVVVGDEDADADATADADVGVHSNEHVQQRWLRPFFLFSSSCEFGSGKLSLGTRCMTVVFPTGSPSAARVTLPCKNRPW